MQAEVIGVIVAVTHGHPVVLAPGTEPGLPAGALLTGAPSLQAATRDWVEEQTGRRPGYLEQLYTFADPGRAGDGHDGQGEHLVSISYLGLAEAPTCLTDWQRWYDLFPWEDRRAGAAGGGIVDSLVPRLIDWAGGDLQRLTRAAVTFGLDEHPWRPDMALQRYELLYEAGLLPETPADRRAEPLAPGSSMTADHRRIVATGIARVRAKIEYRPVVFELLPDEFTLGDLQRCVEAIAGQGVHTQNFRRTVDAQALVEATGGRTTATGGRPAKLFRFRREVLLERQVAGTKVPVGRHR